MTEREIIKIPPTDTVRWVPRRKAAVVKAVQIGQINLAEACERYNLSVEEFLSWNKAFRTHGMGGLKTTRIHDYQPERKSGLDNRQ